MLISVIIPCYNVEHYIQECIESVYAQTYKDIEVICVDNNSTDSTWSILNQIKEKAPQLILLKEFKTGACAARNKGLSLAKGDWVQFLDADDLLLPNKIEHQFMMVQRKNVAVVAAAFKKRHVDKTETEIVHLNDNIFLAAFTNQCGITSSNLWNKDVIKQVGNWNEDIKSSQEADLMMRFALNNNKLLTDKIPLTIIRDRESGQISQRDPAKKWRQYIVVRLNYLSKLKTSFPQIYIKNRDVFIDFLLISLITFAKYNKGEAINIYNTYIKSEHKIRFTNLRSDIMKLVGFKNFISLKN